MDDADTNKKFAEKLNVDYAILSDPDKSTAKAYGVLSDRGFANRWTFYMDKNGVIQEIDKSVKPAEAGKDVAKKLDELGVPKK